MYFYSSNTGRYSDSASFAGTDKQQSTATGTFAEFGRTSFLDAETTDSCNSATGTSLAGVHARQDESQSNTFGAHGRMGFYRPYETRQLYLFKVSDFRLRLKCAANVCI